MRCEVTTPATTTLTDRDVAALEREAWIDQATAEAFGLYRVNSADGAELVGRDNREDYAGIALPVYWPGTARAREYYLRLDHPPLEHASNGKLKARGKYLAPPGRSNYLLFGPDESPDALTDTTLPIVLVEGLKKLCAAWRLARDNSERPQFLACALSGVWNWRGTVGKTTDANGARVDVKGPISDLDRVTWKDRDVIVTFDSDCASNPSVAAARRGLVAELRKRGARATALDLPELDGLDKTGFDDLLAQRGPEAVLGLIETARRETTTAGGSAGRVTYRRASDIQATPIRWLWPGRIARGKVSMLAGNPGLGKSQITVSMAVTVSTAGSWPLDGTPCEVGNVIILSAEDDAGDTIRPRLEAAGANLNRVFLLDAVIDNPSPGKEEVRRAFNLKTDVARLETMLEEIDGAALVVIDPVTAYLGETDSHKNAEVRALLGPLAELAQRRGVAVVCVSHFNKNVHGEALLRVTGSLAFVAAARAALVVTQDPENDTRRLLLPLKNNLGNDRTGLAFRVEPAQVESPSGLIETSRVVWEPGAVTITAEEAMRPQPDSEERTDLDEAKDFLRSLLADGPVSSKQVRADAEGAGHAWRTIQRAQKVLGIVVAKEGMKEGWVWRLDTHLRPEDRQTPPKSANPEVWHSSENGGLPGASKYAKYAEERQVSRRPPSVRDGDVGALRDGEDRRADGTGSAGLFDEPQPDPLEVIDDAG